MIASAGPDEYRSTIETRAGGAGGRRGDRPLHAGRYWQRRSDRARDSRRRLGRPAAGAMDKPVLACVMTEPGHPVQVEVGNERLPAYAFPENAARALGKVVTYAEWRRQEPGLYWGFDDLHVDDARHICRTATRHPRRHVAERRRGPARPRRIRLAARRWRASRARPTQPAALAAAIGLPVAAKLSSARIQHKTDIGAVRLNLRTDAAVRHAFADILSAARTAGHPLTDESGDGVLIQSMVGNGVETMMGIVAGSAVWTTDCVWPRRRVRRGAQDVKFRVAPLDRPRRRRTVARDQGLPTARGISRASPRATCRPCGISCCGCLGWLTHSGDFRARPQSRDCIGPGSWMPDRGRPYHGQADDPMMGHVQANPVSC